MADQQQQATRDLAAEALAKARQYATKAEAELTSVRYPGDNEEIWSRLCANAGHLAQLSQAFSALAQAELAQAQDDRVYNAPEISS